MASGKEQIILDPKTLATRYEVCLISDPSQRAAEAISATEIFICYINTLSVQDVKSFLSLNEKNLEFLPGNLDTIAGHLRCLQIWNNCLEIVSCV